MAASAGHAESGARLLGSAEGLIDSLAAPQFPRDQPILRRGLLALQSALDQEQLTRLREAGKTMRVERVVAEAEDVAHTVVHEAVDEQR